MKKLPIAKETFEKSRYFKNKYGKLEYVSESGKVYKTDKGKILMFKEGTESNPRFKCMEGRNDYDDYIQEFKYEVVDALKSLGDGYIVEPGIDGVHVTDTNKGIDFRLDISVSDEVEM